jgi:hypothetical protein
MSRRDLVDIFNDLETENLPLTQPAPETKIDVRLPVYEKPLAGPVRHISVDEYLATRRSRVG